jgi:CRP-like cAMP-binding protein
MNPINLVKNAQNHETYAAGATIFRAGDVGEYLYIVIEGEVDIEAPSGQFMRTLQAGDIFGEMALIDDSPRSADAVARTDCVLAPVDERRFLFLIHETPMFALHVMSVMAQRLRGHVP